MCSILGKRFNDQKRNSMNNLLLYGWNDQLSQLKQQSTHNNLSHGRVAVVHKTCYEVIGEQGIFTCELTGNMMYGKSQDEYPCTGDWVLFQSFDDKNGIIVDILPRRKTLYRKKSGTVSDRQVIASWLDKVFIVQSLDDNFNVRRVERFLVQVKDEGIEPVLVFTKTDLGVNPDEIKELLKHLGNVSIFFTSIHDSESISLLKQSIEQGQTIVFTGSSGVGKSSLVNALCGEQVLTTSDISISTGKGRHTSTRREMILLKGSGILIDTPGVREFGLAMDDTDAIADVLNISDLEGQCRFADCTHVNEPGCAVIEAVENGIIDKDVYDSYLKLRREAWHYSASVHEKRKYEKSFTGIVKEVKRLKDNR